VPVFRPVVKSGLFGSTVNVVYDPVRQHVGVYATQLVSLPRSVGTGSPVLLPFQPGLGGGSRRFPGPGGLERGCTIT